MNYRLTEHAKDVLKERNIPIKYMKEVLNNPELICNDESDSTLEHRLGKIEEYENRVLRVIYNKTVDPIVIITVYFDRGMKDKL